MFAERHGFHTMFSGCKMYYRPCGSMWCASVVRTHCQGCSSHRQLAEAAINSCVAPTRLPGFWRPNIKTVIPKSPRGVTVWLGVLNMRESYIWLAMRAGLRMSTREGWTCLPANVGSCYRCGYHCYAVYVRPITAARPSYFATYFVASTRRLVVLLLYTRFASTHVFFLCSVVCATQISLRSMQRGT